MFDHLAGATATAAAGECASLQLYAATMDCPPARWPESPRIVGKPALEHACGLSPGDLTAVLAGTSEARGLVSDHSPCSKHGLPSICWP